jgi:hypothetical protein
LSYEKDACRKDRDSQEKRMGRSKVHHGARNCLHFYPRRKTDGADRGNFLLLKNKTRKGAGPKGSAQSFVVIRIESGVHANLPYIYSLVKRLLFSKQEKRVFPVDLFLFKKFIFNFGAKRA